MTKKFLLFTVACLTLSLLTLTSTNAYANVFASDVKVVNPGGLPFDGNLNDGTPGVGIEFILNENATSVVIEVSDGGGVVATIDAGPQGKGRNLVVWSGLNDAGDPVPAGDYTFSVTANDANGHSAYDIVYAKSGTKVFTRGGTTIRNPAAANFGHPIGGNGGGGGLKRGPLNFFADGTGFENFATDADVLARYSPFDVRDLGGAGRLYMLTSDDDGNLYYSDRLDGLSKIYTFSADLDTASFAVVATSDDSAKSGLGIDVVGTGAARTIYWGLANTVVRMPIGDAATFDIANAELVATFGDTIFIRDLVIDDSGFLYVSLRKGGEPSGSNPGVAVERYDISGALPVSRADAQWSIPVGQDNGDGRPVGFGLEHGADPASNVDDVIYFSNASGSADGAWNGIHKIDDLAAGGSTLVFEDISGSGTTSSNADMSVDAAGNLVFFENSSEWLFSISPPDGANSFTTPANDVISITNASTANAFPGINDVLDVPGDQGFQVLVHWAGSAMDRLGSAGIADYEVYRQVPDGAATSKGGNNLQGPPGRWELVGTTSARQTSNYGLTVPTVVNGAASTFFISAVNLDGTRYDSQAASGTSVDNLIPTAPSGLIANEVETGISLAWNDSPDEDFNYFSVVRGNQAGFDAASAEEIGTTTSTEFVDTNVSAGETWYYRVVAFDFSANKGDFSDEISLQVTSVAGNNSSVPETFALEQNYPNPFNPTTNIRYDLAKDSQVSLKIYNIMGQEVANLVHESQRAGRYTISWNATNNIGVKVSSGVYIYVLKAGEFVKSQRLTLLK